MTVAATALVLKDVTNTPFSSVPRLIKRAHMPADFAAGECELIFVLFEDGSMAVGYSLKGKFSRLIVPPSHATEVTVTGFDVFTVPADQGQPAVYPVLFIHHTNANEVAAEASKIAVVQLKDEAIGLEDIATVWDVDGAPTTSYGAQVRTAPAIIGYRGTEAPDDYFAMSPTIGWWAGTFHEVGTVLWEVTTSATEYGVFGNGLSNFYVEYPRVHHRRQTFARGIRYSYMDLDQSSDFLPRLLVHEGNNEINCKMVMPYYDPEFAEFSGVADPTVHFVELRPGSGAMSLGSGGFVPWPWDCGASENPADTTTLDYYLRHNTPKFFHVAWGLSGDVVPPETNPPEALYGGPSLLCVHETATAGTYRITVFGDGKGTQDVDMIVDAIAFGYKGTVDNPRLPSGVHDTPLQRVGVVMVSWDKVFFSADGTGFGDTPVFTIPNMADRFGWQEITYATEVYSVDLRYMKDGAVGPEGFYLAVVFKGPGEGGSTYAAVYYSEDGVTWVHHASTDLNTAVGVLAPVYDTWTHSSAEAGARPSIAIITSETIYMEAGFHLTGTGGASEFSSVLRKGVEDWEEYATASPAFNTFDYSAACFHSASGSAYVLSGSGTRGHRVAPGGQANDSWFLNKAFDITPGANFPAQRLSLWNMAWIAEKANKNEKFYATTCFPMMLDGAVGPLLLTTTEEGGSLPFTVETDMEGTNIRPLLFVEDVSPYDPYEPTPGFITAAKYTVAYSVTAPSIGTISFLRGPLGVVSHMQFSSKDTLDSFSDTYLGIPYACRSTMGVHFSDYGSNITDIYVEGVGAANHEGIRVYLCLESGLIDAFRLSDWGYATTYSGLEGKKNLHLAKVNETWIATYGETSSGVSVSLDLTTWTEAVAEGESEVAALTTPAIDLITFEAQGMPVLYVTKAHYPPTVFGERVEV